MFGVFRDGYFAFYKVAESDRTNFIFFFLIFRIKIISITNKIIAPSLKIKCSLTIILKRYSSIAVYFTYTYYIMNSAELWKQKCIIREKID